MENGLHEDGDHEEKKRLTDKLSGLALNFDGLPVKNNNVEDINSENNSLFQVMKAVEAAEATIKQQVDENNRLRNELQRKMHELERYVRLTKLQIRRIWWFRWRSKPNISKSVAQIESNDNSSSLWKQEHEEEIMQLRKHLAEYSIKEGQIRNEKYLLEKRIAYMRLAFDQQQQELVDAASKALSYRQDIIEENIRLTYQLQAAQQERSTFVSSLLPLLSDYSLQPQGTDAQSIVSNVKVLFKHLQEKLIVTESKLKELQYQLAPWRTDDPQSASHSIGADLTSNKHGLELVAQPMYSQGKIPTTSSHVQTATDWDHLGHPQGDSGGVITRNLEFDDLGRFSPLSSRNEAAHDMPAQLAVTRADVNIAKNGDEGVNKQVTFRDPVSNGDIDESDTEGHQNEREPSNWPGNSPYTTTLDDPSYSPFLPPVLEEPSSSFSEAADDALPAIEGLQISGEAYPGKELQASGYSINGTTSCNFEWVRHLEDGSVNYIEGAKQPNYLVNADDVDSYLAIEVQPLDDRKRKGELVKVFANEHRKITCEPGMQLFIEKALHQGHASFKVSYSSRFLDIWEQATLAIKRDAFSVKCSGSSGVVVTEKFSPSTSVAIPYGHDMEFVVICSDNSEYLLRAEGNPTDFSCSRDTIVLTMRLFILRAGEKKKGKKRVFLFNEKTTQANIN
ncbi:uncharacterized protein [Rutidosis leptorrhynchoides]|uniref:uncharacterized protein n=1 Tax=Rutidosis leptorrhynchoides TaxID=125765 RepID=UPI003A98F5E6